MVTANFVLLLVVIKIYNICIVWKDIGLIVSQIQLLEQKLKLYFYFHIVK